MKENYFVKDKLKKIAISNYLKKKLAPAGFIDVEVVKSVFNTRIVIYALKPGFVIGKKGANIRALTDDLEKRFELSKVHVEIGDIPNRNLDPKVIIENIFTNIENGVNWKSVVYGALRQIKEAGAIGAEIIAKGNTSGKGQRKRKSRFFFGYMKKAGEQKDLVGIEKRTTFPSLGTIGITLRIVTPDTVFSDKIDIVELSKRYRAEIQEEELLERKEEIEKENQLLETEKDKVKEKTKIKEDSEKEEGNKKIPETKPLDSKTKTSKPKTKTSEPKKPNPQKSKEDKPLKDQEKEKLSKEKTKKEIAVVNKDIIEAPQTKPQPVVKQAKQAVSLKEAAPPKEVETTFTTSLEKESKPSNETTQTNQEKINKWFCMVKKKKITQTSLAEIDEKIIKLKLELANFKGVLASKTKSNNTSKKKELKKEIARYLTKKNELVKKKEV